MSDLLGAGALRLQENAGCVSFAVRVHPGAKTTAITGTHDGALKISLNAPPADGRANDALLRLLAERLKVPRRSVELVSGAASRSKSVRVVGISSAEIEVRLLGALG